jgi:centrosomal protein CEP104
MEDLRSAGERLSKYELEKRHAIQLEDYERAKLKKAQMEDYRRTVYQFLEVDDLLEINGVRSNQIFRSMQHTKYQIEDQ